MGFLDKAMAAAEQAAMKAKGTAEELQTKRELGQAYGDLGRKALELIEAGTLSSAELDPFVARVQALKTELEERQAAGETAPADATEEPATADEERSATPS
jgi:hypothetical protein